MKEEFQRLALLIGKEKMNTLHQKHVAVFGLGGVGGFAAEAIARSGIGKLTLVDYDTVDITNINRQIIALQSTVGKSKVMLWKERILEMDPSIQILGIDNKYTEQNGEEFFEEAFDYIVDAIDMVSSKIHLILKAKEKNIPIISCMGMGNKMDPTRIQITDIYKTRVCPLAKVMRKELRNKNVTDLLCVFSDEEPIKPYISLSSSSKREIPGSNAFVPSVAGLMMAARVVSDLVD